MKTAMFVLAIIELSFIVIGACLHNVKIDVNDWKSSNTFIEFAVLSIVVWVGIALSVLAIISKCI